MSHSDIRLSNKNQRQSKVNFRDYIHNADEPDDKSYPETVSWKRTRPLEESDDYYMGVKMHIRHKAQRLRLNERYS